jgi:excisionase family DNA binding protein
MTDAAPALLTLREACARLALSERTLRGMVARAEIPVVNFGRAGGRATYRFEPRVIADFIRERTQCEPRKSGASPSPAARRSGNSTSNFEVVDFAALRAARIGARRKDGSATTVRKRNSKPPR